MTSVFTLTHTFSLFFATEHRTFKTPSNKTIDVSSVASNYHIEISCSDAGIYDRFVVQEVIKEIASSNSLHGQVEGAKGFKVVLLMEVDRLTTQAQAALRRTMEKYTSSCRLILYATNPTKVMEPLRSRCLCLRVPAPTHDQVRCPETLEVTCMRPNWGALLPLAMMHAIIHAMMHAAASEASLLRPPLPSLAPPPVSASFSHFASSPPGPPLALVSGSLMPRSAMCSKRSPTRRT